MNELNVVPVITYSLYDRSIILRRVNSNSNGINYWEVCNEFNGKSSIYFDFEQASKNFDVCIENLTDSLLVRS